MMEAKQSNFNFTSNESELKIPFFQRSYVWGEENWEKLYDDLKYSFENNKENFLGSVILKRSQKSKNMATIIDGQQRITTFSILLKAMVNNMLDEKNKTGLMRYLY